MHLILKDWKSKNGQGVFESSNNKDIISCIKIMTLAMPERDILITCPDSDIPSFRSEFNDIVPFSSLANKEHAFVKHFTLVVINIHRANHTINALINNIKTTYRLYITNKFDSVHPAVAARVSRIVKKKLVEHLEHNYIIDMPDDVKVKYEEICTVMDKTLNLFRDYDNLRACVNGSDDGRDAHTFRIDYAKSNGWSEGMDESIPMFADIARYYHPDNLYASALHHTELVRERDNIISRSSTKAKAAVGLCMANATKQIVLIAKGDDVCDRLANDLRINGVKAESIHANTPSANMKDSDGNYIVYKSGAKKGQPKVFGAKLLNDNVLELFKQRKVRVIVTTGTLAKTCEIKGCDVMVTMTPKSKNYYLIKSRIHAFDFVDNINIINIVFDVAKDLEVIRDRQNAYAIRAVDALTISDVIL